jgi:hypothetical protein
VQAVPSNRLRSRTSTSHHSETLHHTAMYNDIFAAYKPENEINKDVDLQGLLSVNRSVQLSFQHPSSIW